MKRQPILLATIAALLVPLLTARAAEVEGLPKAGRRRTPIAA